MLFCCGLLICFDFLASFYDWADYLLLPGVKHLLTSSNHFICHFFQQSKDGIFWMSWQDFQIHFRSIYICRIYPSEMRHSVHGQWRGYSAGGCQDYDTWNQNPQFRLTATGQDASFPIHVFITLTQVLLIFAYLILHLQKRTFPLNFFKFHFMIFIGCGIFKNNSWF